METIKFKTNIKCAGCISTITPFLNKTAGEGNWEVDLQDAARTLTIKGTIPENEILAAVKEAGFTAEKV